MIEQKRIEAGGLIYKEHLGMVGLLCIPTRPGIGGQYFSELADSGIHVELIVHVFDGQKCDHIMVCVDRDDLDSAHEITKKCTKLSAAAQSSLMTRLPWYASPAWTSRKAR